MATREKQAVPIEQISVADRFNWAEGPPHEDFRRLRRECPVHFGEVNDFPEEEGIWSVTKAEDVRRVSLDWETFSSAYGITGLRYQFPLELVQAMFIGMDPPKHDRLKMLFQRGFTPKRIAEHTDEIRAITTSVLDRLEGRETCDLVPDVAQPVVSRVIGSFMGIPEEDDAAWAT